MKRVSVVGEGAWGTAIAMLLADNGYTVFLWCQDPEVARSIETTRINKRYFPDFSLPKTIIPVTDFSHLSQITFIFEAIPVCYLRSVLTQMRPHLRKDHVITTLSKGIEEETLLFPHDVVREVAGISLEQAVLAGPSFAQEVAEKRATAVTLAASPKVASALQPMLANRYFRPYLTDDLVGVQVGAALKNVIALGVGMAQGAGLSDNTVAFVLTRGLDEMVQVAVALGGRRETVYGLSGVGDLVLSSMGKHGRNLAIGRLLGQGKKLAEVASEIDVLPESVNTTVSLHQLMERREFDLPVCEGIYQILQGRQNMAELVAVLMARPLESEFSAH